MIRSIAMSVGLLLAAGASSAALDAGAGTGTRAGNPVGAVRVRASERAGNLTTTYKDRTNSDSIGSGANGIFCAGGAIPHCANGFQGRAMARSLPATARRPFSCGRTFVAIAGRATPAGPGPYWSF